MAPRQHGAAQAAGRSVKSVSAGVGLGVQCG